MTKQTKQKKLTKELSEKIRLEFVQGVDLGTNERKYQTIDALALKHKVARSTLYKRSQAESWKQQQDRFHIDFMAELDEARKKEFIEESKTLDRTAINLSKIILNEVGLMFQENNMKRRDGEQSLTPQLIYQLSSASLQAQKLAKLALGESTENMKLNAEISDTDAFREAMELLDSVAESSRDSDSKAVH